MLKRIAPCLFVMVGCGGTPPPPHVPSEARSSAKAGPHPSSAEPKLPTACERAQQKRLKASKLYPQGYVQRSQRLAEQAFKLCPAEQQASKALLSEIAASAIDHRGQSGDDLWAKSETARAAGDLSAARRLASSASSAFAKAGTPTSAWAGVSGLRPLALSRDGSKLAAADPEAKLVLLETRTLKPLRFLEVPEARGAKVARFSPDGAVLGVLTSRGVLLLDTSSGVLKRTLSWAGELSTQFAFSKDGTSVVVGGYSRRSATVRRFELASGDAQAEYQLAKGHGVSALAVSERDGRVAVGFETGKLELLDGMTLKSVKVLGDGKKGRPQLLAFSPVEDRLAMLSDDTRLAVLDTASGKPILDVDIGQAGQHSICRFSSDGTRVLLNGGDRREALLEFDAKDGHALRAKPMPSRDLVLAPDGKLAVASANGRIGLFVVDTTSGEVIRSATTPSIRLKGMAFTDGALAIARQLSRGSDQRVEVLLTSARAPSSHFLTVPGYSAKLTFSEAGERLAGYFGRSSVFYWDVAASGQRRDLPDFPGWVSALSFSSRDVLHAAGGPSDLKLGTVRVGEAKWDTQVTLQRQKGRRGAALANGHAVVRGEDALSTYDLKQPKPEARPLPGGNERGTLTLSGDGRVLILVTNEGIQRVQLEGPPSRQLLSARCTRGPVAASRDGSVVVAACKYRELSVFRDGEQQTIQLHADALEISPSGEVIAVGQDDMVSLLGADLKPRVDLRFTGPAAAQATAPDGKLELLGDQTGAGQYCIVAQRAYPFELCEDQLLQDDLVVDALLPN